MTADRHGKRICALAVAAGVLLIFFPWIMGLFR
jgi:hypothetical protein